MHHKSQLFSTNFISILAFFADFERQTQGENFSSSQLKSKEDSIEEHNYQNKINQNHHDDKEASKDDMNDFFDEFEKTTGGENFRIRDED